MTRPAAGDRHDILFPCTGDPARSLMAGAIVNARHAERVCAHSAGSHPEGAAHPMALHLLQRRGFDTAGLRPEMWDAFAYGREGAPDFAFTLCDAASGETWPVRPGRPVTAHRGVPDPAAARESEAERHLAFAEAFRVPATRPSVPARLPIASLDRASLERRPGEIGTRRGEQAQDVEGGRA